MPHKPANLSQPQRKGETANLVELPRKAIVIPFPTNGGSNPNGTDPKGPNPSDIRQSLAVSLEVIGLTLWVAARRAGIGINEAAEHYVEHATESRNAAYRAGFEAGRKSKVLSNLRRAAA